MVRDTHHSRYLGGLGWFLHAQKDRTLAQLFLLGASQVELHLPSQVMAPSSQTSSLFQGLCLSQSSWSALAVLLSQKLEKKATLTSSYPVCGVKRCTFKVVVFMVRVRSQAQGKHGFKNNINKGSIRYFGDCQRLPLKNHLLIQNGMYIWGNRTNH